MERLRPHIAKHTTGALSPSVKKELEDNNNEESNDSSNNIGEYFFYLICTIDV